MKNRDKTFIWSDGWWIEDNKAWFVGGMSNVLFGMDLNTGECENVAYIPDSSECTFRLTPFCLKYERDIFCIPGFGQSIWIYNLNNKSFTKIDIDKPDQLQVGSQLWVLGDTIFVVLVHWNKVIEVSISEKVIKNYYTICEEDSVRKSVLVGNSIYMVSSSFSRIYQFDLSTKRTKIFTLPGAEKKLFTICFDGEKFWLSGYHKEVYIWDKENNRLTTVENFPRSFGIYDFTSNTDAKVDFTTNEYEVPTFNHSVVVGDYIWFIPIQVNKIIYANKKNDTLLVFEIHEEDETKESILLRQLWGIGNYLLEYVRADRYIGLFSAKSSRILEIDAKELKYQWKEYYFNDKRLLQLQYGGIYKKIYREGIDDALYALACRMGIQTSGKKNNINTNRVGMEIYKKLIEERTLQ